MPIISIQRDTNNNISIVRMQVSDTLADVSSTDYILNNQDNINQLNNGLWQWFITDMILVSASDGNGFYEFLNTNFATIVSIAGSGSGTINPGLQYNIPYYSTNGTTLSPLSNLPNAILATNGSNVPALNQTLPTLVQSHITTVGIIGTGTWQGTPITVPYGGTGDTNFTAYSVICAGTISTGNFQNVSGLGSSGFVLTSNGAGSLPTWQASSGSGTVSPGTINDLAFYQTTSSTVSPLATANNSVLVTSGFGVPSLSQTLPISVQTNITELGTITTGVWHGSVIPGQYGGTGVANTGLTINLGSAVTGYVLTSDVNGNATWQANPGSSDIATINGDSGSITGTTVTIYANNASLNAGSSVRFVNSGTTSTLNVTDSRSNTIIGLNSGVLSNSAIQCVSLGANTLSSITDDEFLVAIGYSALQSANDSSENVAVGSYSLNTLVSGGVNTAIGDRCGLNLSSGNFNTLFGASSAINYTGSESSNVIISHSGVLGESNVMRLGTTGSGSSQVNKAFVAGINGNTVSNTLMVTIDSSTDQLGVQILPIQTTWQVVTASPISAIANNGYITNSVSQIQITLPATFNIGDVVEVRGLGTGGWNVLPNSGQTIQFASVTASTSITSNIQYSNITIRGIVPNTTWTVDLTNENPTFV